MPTAEEAAAANAAYRAANNLPADAANAAILASTQGQIYQQQYQQQQALQDAYREQMKHDIAFSQPRNDLDFQHSAAYDAIVAQYNQQRHYSVGSGGLTYQPTGGVPYARIENPRNAAQIAYNVAIEGGNLNPGVQQRSIAEGFNPTPYVNRPVLKEVATRQDIAQYDRVGNPLNSRAAYEQSMRNAQNMYGRAGYTGPETLGDVSTQRAINLINQFRQPLAMTGLLRRIKCFSLRVMRVITGWNFHEGDMLISGNDVLGWDCQRYSFRNFRYRCRKQ